MIQARKVSKSRKFASFLKFITLRKSPSSLHPNPQSGMTIIEILIVIALIGTIMTIVMTNVIKSSEDAKVDLTVTAQNQIKQALTMYKMNVNKFPATEDGLQALLEKPANAKGWRGPYSEDDKLKDAFGNDMQYELLSPSKFKLTSPGIDGEFNTPDDIVYPKNLAPEATVSTELNVPNGQKDAQ